MPKSAKISMCAMEWKPKTESYETTVVFVIMIAQDHCCVTMVQWSYEESTKSM